MIGSGLGGDGFWLDATDERLPVRGGRWSNGALRGVFVLYFARSPAAGNLGARPAFVS